MHDTSDRSKRSKRRISRTPTYSLSEVLARILASSEKEPEWKEAEVPLSATHLMRFGISDLTFLSGKMLRECSSQNIARISSPYLKRLPTLGVIDSNGNCLIQAGFYPRIESGYTLSDVLLSDVPEAFFLSEKSIARMVKHGYNRVLVLGRGITNSYIVESPGESDHRTGMKPEYFKKVRMLTPVECERLQGFPDDFTRLGNYDGQIRPISLVQRYCLLGNAVSVPTVEAVASRIKNNTILD